jgi:hypothetical protein
MKPDSTSPRVLVPSFAVSACTTYHSTYPEDLESFRAVGIRGIGLWEYKLPTGRDAESVERLAESGLMATFCFRKSRRHLRDILFSRQGIDRRDSR